MNIASKLTILDQIYSIYEEFANTLELDVLGVLSSEDNQAAYRSNELTCQKTGLIPNHPLNILMIPPEHRTRMEPILQKLRQIKL